MSNVLVSPEHEVLVIPRDDRVVNLFPHHRTLPDGRLVVPHAPDEVRVLRNLGYKVPSPIVHNYDWGGVKPFKAQKVTAAMLVVEPRAFVLSTMGTGKTLATLMAYDFLRKKKISRRMLVVAPLSTLNFTWAKEIMTYFPHLKWVVVHGTRARRRKLLREKADVFIINHDGLSVVEEELKQMLTRDDIICFDEVSAFRNARSKRHKVAVRVASRVYRVWGLTGTPTTKAPTDAYGIIRLVNPDRPGLPRSFTHFRDELMVRHGPFKWLPRPGAQEKVYGYMQPSVRFTLEECVDMPPVVRRTYEAQLTAKQKSLYSEITKHCKAAFEAGQITAANEGVVLNKLAQISCGCVFTDDRDPVHLDSPDRFNVLKELLDENDRSAIVFAPFVPVVDMLAEKLAEDGYTVHKVHGGVGQKERSKVFNTFQNGTGKQVLVAHPAAMAHGLTLTAASMVVWYAPVWDLEVYEQANARIVRPGQTANRVLIAEIAATPVERRIYKRLAAKQTMQNILLEMFE